jgi:hypothetical protein
VRMDETNDLFSTFHNRSLHTMAHPTQIRSAAFDPAHLRMYARHFADFDANPHIKWTAFSSAHAETIMLDVDE